MTCFAQTHTPLGDVLLCAEDTGLSGLYFTDQRDCPRVEGLEVPSARIEHPAAGEVAGHALRRLRVQRREAVAPGLFDRPPDDAHGTLGPLHWLDGATSPAHGFVQQAAEELSEYFSGRRTHFDVPLVFAGTEFQVRVWHALCAVPFGQTVSYRELALRAGLQARHSRPVGAAVGQNPISVIVPCHRVLAADGTLNGYGGGLPRKMRLLRLEGFAID